MRNLQFGRLFIYIVFGLCATHALTAQRTAESLESEAGPIFVMAMPVERFLPELAAQLELPVLIELGRLEPVSPTGHPKGRTIGPFESNQMTKRQVLNAVEKKWPAIQWSKMANGAVQLRWDTNENNDGEQSKVLDWPLDGLKTRGYLNDVVWHIRNRLKPVFSKKYPKGEELTVEGGISPRSPTKRYLFDERVEHTDEVSITKKEKTTREAIERLMGQVPNLIWIAAELERAGIAFGTPPGFLLSQSAWSPQRREADVPQLITWLNPANEDLAGYQSKEVRMEDARRALTRHYHFNPDKVRKAMLDAKILTKVVNAAEGHRITNRFLWWLKDLKDKKLLRQVFEAAMKLEVKEEPEFFDKRRMLLGSVPEPGEPFYETLGKLFLKKLLQDQDPYLRKYARRQLAKENESNGQ